MIDRTMMVGLILSAAIVLPLHAQNPARNPAPMNGGYPLHAGQHQTPATIPASPNPIQGMKTPPLTGTGTEPRHSGNRGFNVQHLPSVGPGIYPYGSVYVEAFVDTGAVSTVAAPGIPNVPAVPAAPQEFRGGATSIERYSSPTSPGPDANTSRLEPGTPRDVVIATYGNPVAYILNMNGETLYFRNNVEIFLKDGVVAAPAKQ